MESQCNKREHLATFSLVWHREAHAAIYEAVLAIVRGGLRSEKFLSFDTVPSRPNLAKISRLQSA